MPWPTSIFVSSPSPSSWSRARYTLARATPRRPSRSFASISYADRAHDWSSSSSMTAARAPPRRKPASARRAVASSDQAPAEAPIGRQRTFVVRARRSTGLWLSYAAVGGRSRGQRQAVFVGSLYVPLYGGQRSGQRRGGRRLLGRVDVAHRLL